MIGISTIRRTLGIGRAAIETPYVCWMCSAGFISAAEFLCHINAEKGN